MSFMVPSPTGDGSHLSTSLVGRETRHATVGIHLGEVHCSVQAARKVRHINVESELLVVRLEQVVRRVCVKKVDTGTNIAARNELESESVTASRDTIGARVIGSVKGAVGRASRRVRAKRRIPVGGNIAQ